MTTFKARSGIEMWKVKTKKKEIALRFSDHIKEFHPQSPYSDFVWKKNQSRWSKIIAGSNNKNTLGY